MPTLYETTGLNISVFAPTIVAGTSYTPRGSLVSDNLHDYMESYDHEHAAMGGYYSARIGLRLSQEAAEDWLDHGLGRHIEVTGFDLAPVWAGFVNKVSVRVGSLSVDRGPLMDIANRASVIYAPVLDATVSPPIVGVRQSSVLADSSESQDRYGIIEKTLSGGTCTDEDAERYRDTYLQEYADPVTSQNLTPGGGEEPSVTLECLGYWAWLQAYPYDTTATGTTTVSAKLQAILGADTNGLFLTDYSALATNAYLTPAEEDDDAPAWNVIKALVSLGDVNDARYSFGVYDSRRARYRNATDLETHYQHRIGATDQAVETFGVGRLVYPWDVRADEWLFLPDFLAGKTSPTSRRLDPRYIYLESVKYTAPWGLTLNGSRLGRLSQVLAKQGLGGA